MSKKKPHTKHIVAINKQGVLCSKWDLSGNKPALESKTYTVTEIPFLAHGSLNNPLRLSKIIKDSLLPEKETSALHVILELDHAQEQLMFNPPEQKAPPSDPEEILLHTPQHLFTTHDGTNVQLYTTLHVALLTQLQLLANSINSTLRLTTTFSHAFLYAYTRLHHTTNHARAKLYNDLKKVEYEYIRLCRPSQLLPSIENAACLQGIRDVAPTHLTASIATILFLSEQDSL